MGTSTTVSAFAFDREQHSFFDFAWSANSEFSVSGVVSKFETVKSGLGGGPWASGIVSGELCGSFPILGRVLSSGELGRGGTDTGLWKVGAALLVAWTSEASVALFTAPSGTAVVV